MNRYIYEITGLYKDSLKMKNGDIIFHQGNLIDLMSYSHERLELKLNYGTEVCHPCEIKKINEIIITIPIKEYLFKRDYLYIPLAFEQKEYEKFVGITYIDQDLSNNIRQVNKQDIYNLLTMNFKRNFTLLESMFFKDIISNIVSFSDYDDEIMSCINTMVKSKDVNIRKLNKNDLTEVIVFVDYLNNLYEWKSVFKYNNKFYFKLINEYMFEIN